MLALHEMLMHSVCYVCSITEVTALKMVWNNCQLTGSTVLEECLQRRDRVTNDRYRAQRVACKLAVQAAKIMADRRWGEQLWKISSFTKKIFWKEVKRVRKGEPAREEMVKDVNGQTLHNGVEVRRSWAEYFEQVLNVADVREANINVVGNWQMPVLGDLNERAISLEEVGETVNE